MRSSWPNPSQHLPTLQVEEVSVLSGPATRTSRGGANGPWVSLGMARGLPVRLASKPCPRSRIHLPPQPLQARPALTYLTYGGVIRGRTLGGCIACLFRFPERQERVLQRTGVLAIRHADHGAPTCQIRESDQYGSATSATSMGGALTRYLIETRGATIGRCAGLLAGLQCANRMIAAQIAIALRVRIIPLGMHITRSTDSQSAATHALYLRSASE